MFADAAVAPAEESGQQADLEDALAAGSGADNAAAPAHIRWHIDFGGLGDAGVSDAAEPGAGAADGGGGGAADIDWDVQLDTAGAGGDGEGAGAPAAVDWDVSVDDAGAGDAGSGAAEAGSGSSANDAAGDAAAGRGSSPEEAAGPLVAALMDSGDARAR